MTAGTICGTKLADKSTKTEEQAQLIQLELEFVKAH